MDNECIGVDHHRCYTTVKACPQKLYFQIFGMLQLCHLVFFYYHKYSCPFKVGEHVHIGITVRVLILVHYCFYIICAA